MTIIDRAKQHLEQTGIHGMAEAKGIIRELLGEIDRLNAELAEARRQNEDLLNIVEGYDICCCGAPIKNHGYTDNHGPVSMLDHHIRCRVESQLSALKQGEKTAEARGLEHPFDGKVCGKDWCKCMQ